MPIDRLCVLFLHGHVVVLRHLPDGVRQDLVALVGGVHTVPSSRNILLPQVRHVAVDLLVVLADALDLLRAVVRGLLQAVGFDLLG